MSKIGYLLLGILAVIAIVFAAGMLSAAEPSQEFTVGNSTFVLLPVEFAGSLVQKKLAMETVQKFEKTHPELVVLCWNPSYIVSGMNVAIDGVYIYHRPK